MSNKEKCFICQAEKSERISAPGYDGDKYSCPFCGEYTISRSASCSIMANERTKKEFEEKAPCLAAEMKLKGETPFEIMVTPTGRPIVNGHDFLDTYPDDFEEKIYRSLLNLYKNFKPLQTFAFRNERSYLFFEKTANDAILVVKALQQLGYIEIKWASVTQPSDQISLTLDGWKAAKKFNEQTANKNTAFIAMWFDVNATGNYRTATKDAIRQAGYEPVIVDEVMHNDFIMDKIINQINEARFVIADFSCAPETVDKDKIKNGVRGGVYYEAGYAKGLGLQVIHTCNKNTFDQNRLHFDIQQKSTIIWEDDNGTIKTNGNDYTEYLKEHIIATVGKGKNSNAI